MGLPFAKGQPKRRDQIIAIDLGACSTKGVHLQRRGDRFTLLNYVVVDKSVQAAQDKEPSRETLTELFKEVTQSLGNGRHKNLTVALGVIDCVFRQVEVPLMPLDDMRLMLKFHSKNYLQQDLPDHVFDCYYIPSQPGKNGEPVKNTGTMKQKVMVGGARQELVEQVEQAIKGAGLIADQVVPGIIGPANAFEASDPETFGKEAIALVDLGFKNSSITILDCGEIKLNRVVGIGGERFTAGLAEALNISPLEAENIKIGMPDEVQPNLESIINPLGRELRASIDFFEHQYDKTINQVFVSGGSARSEVILKCLQNELMVCCKNWNPTRSLQLELSPQKMGEIEQVAPQLAVAIGAAASAF
jgi:type IV pilus assembly protein PilM